MNFKEYKRRCFALMTKGELMTELLHKIIIHLKKAQLAVVQNDLQTVNQCLIEAQLILTELSRSMRRKDHETKQAADLFMALAENLKAANIHRDWESLADILDFIEQLHATYSFQMKHKG